MPPAAANEPSPIVYASIAWFFSFPSPDCDTTATMVSPSWANGSTLRVMVIREAPGMLSGWVHVMVPVPPAQDQPSAATGAAVTPVGMTMSSVNPLGDPLAKS